MKISIYDVVVGDVIPLRIGDQVGILCLYIPSVALKLNDYLALCIVVSI